MRFPLFFCSRAVTNECCARARLAVIAVALLALSACNQIAPQADAPKPQDAPETRGIPLSKAPDGMLATSPDSYLEQAQGVRQALDRPWAPADGRLGNLRHVQITARDCVLRVVSGNENRVFPGTQGVIVVEGSRVLDSNPNEQPAPRDVVLAPDGAQACLGVGACGVSITPVRAAALAAAGAQVCFTLQLASAHDLLVGGDGLNLLIERLQQPALRLSINPSADL